MITSTNNQQLKNVQLLLDKPRYRRETGLFVAEGIKMFLEAPLSLVDKIYVSQEFMSKSIHAPKIEKLNHEVVTTEIFNKISGTKTPQGVLLVLKQPRYDENKLMATDKGLYLVLNGIQDPGNLGTMIRTAEGAGVKAVIMDRDCADIFNPKVIRSTMGSIYRVPFVISEDLSKTILKMKENGIKVAAAHLKGTAFYDETDYTDKAAILIGNEGRGLSDEISELSDIRVKIPMSGKVESLNAAISAALLMYAARV